MRAGLLSVGAGVIAIAATALVLDRAAPPPVSPAPIARPLVLAPAVPLDEAVITRLFAAPTEADTAAPGDAPAVAGIVGRLPDDAVVLVRIGGGGTRKLAQGESIDGWRLDSIAQDAVLFTRGDRRVRVSPGETAPDQ